MAEKGGDVLLEGIAVNLVGDETCSLSCCDVVVEVVDVEALGGINAALGYYALEDGRIRLGYTELKGAEAVIEAAVYGVAKFVSDAEYILPMDVTNVAEEIDVVVFTKFLNEGETRSGDGDH